MRFCKFCDSSFDELDQSHWISNGKLSSRCRHQRIAYSANNKVKIRQYNQKYYSENRENILSSMKTYFAENSDKISLSRFRQREENPLLRIKDSYGAAAKRAFAQNGYKKNTKSAKILNCSYEELCIYLESQFDEAMTWQNYGIIWEIDHICPLHQAKTYDEVIKLCSYLNLRPLPVTLNRSKSKRKTKEAEILCKSLLRRDWE